MYSKFALEGINVVILAKNYNPSIVSKEWLYEKDIVRETARNFVHTPAFSLVETERISLVLTEDRLQISLKSISSENIESLPDIATKFVSHLPETPYTAVGFNYDYHAPKASTSIETLFSPDEAKLGELFSQDYEIGGTVLFQFKEFVVRMSATPVKEGDSKMAIHFNFHSDSPGAEKVKERLNLHSQTMKKAEEILRGLSE